MLTAGGELRIIGSKEPYVFRGVKSISTFYTFYLSELSCIDEVVFDILRPVLSVSYRSNEPFISFIKAKNYVLTSRFKFLS